jgi:hypothetical protein
LFTNREASTRIIKWGAELSEYIVDLERISAIQLQVLADFVVDWTSPTQNLDEEIPTPSIVQCDGAWFYKGVGISAVVTSPTGVVIRYAARLKPNWLCSIDHGHMASTNNRKRSHVLLHGQVMVRQLNGLIFRILQWSPDFIMYHLDFSDMVTIVATF